jgi:hypothetical protein
MIDASCCARDERRPARLMERYGVNLTVITSPSFIT